MKGSARVYGIDFSSAPTSKKPITVAVGSLDLHHGVYRLSHVSGLTSLPAFEAFLTTPGPWLGGFDLPFGQPRVLIAHEGWPERWRDFVRFFCAADRQAIRARFKAWCDSRPVGDKFAWRATDRPAGSSPAMRWTNPPVAWMMQAGIGRMVEAGLCFPAHGDQCPGLLENTGPVSAGLGGLGDPAEPGYSREPGDPDRPSGSPASRRVCLPARIALEAYPGFTARQVTRQSYKSDTRAKQDSNRAYHRQQILRALLRGEAGLRPRLVATAGWIRQLTIDGSGDLLDAVICALQAAHAATEPRFGLPDRLDPLEGWIAAVPH
nr:hypothetical protein NCPCFENI_01076 [Cupriavidus sp.]